MNDINYTDFFTKDMKKLKSNCKEPIVDVYNLEKVKNGKIKPPNSPKMFSEGFDTHVMIAQKKELYEDLYKKYPEWFDFVSSHKKRWCCCDDAECPNPEDDCKRCYDELSIYLEVPHYEAYLQGKYEYTNPLSKMGTDTHYNFVDNLIKLHNKEITTTFYNINNIESDDYQREYPEKFEEKKNKLHDQLEKMYPEKEFYNNIV